MPIEIRWSRANSTALCADIVGLAGPPERAGGLGVICAGIVILPLPVTDGAGVGVCVTWW